MDITQYFLEAEKGLLNYGQYAARLPMAVERVNFYISIYTTNCNL